MSIRPPPTLSRAVWIIVLALLTLSIAALPPSMRALANRAWDLGPVAETGEVRLLVLVRSGRPLALSSTPNAAPLRSVPLRATSIAMQEARSPEAGEMDLAPWEGKLLLLEGRDSGGWLYSARIVRPLSPLERSIARWAWPAAARSPSP
jgi:hypothetical protein